MKTPSLSEVQPEETKADRQVVQPAVESTSFVPLVETPSRSASFTNSMHLKNIQATDVRATDIQVNTSKRDNSGNAIRENVLRRKVENNGKLAPLENSEALDDVVNIYLQQAEAYCDESQWRKAIAACEEALEIFPTASTYKLLGNILQRQSKLTDAMGFYAKALALQPNSPEIYSNLGSLYARKKQWTLAIDYFHKAIAKNPSFAPAHSNLAKVWKKLGNQEQELASLQTALQLQPEMGSASSHYRIGQSLEEKEDVETAIVFYRQAIEQSLDFLPAYQRLVELLEDRGDWQSAVTYYRKVVELTAKSAAAPSSAAGNAISRAAPRKTHQVVNQPPAQQAKAKINLSQRDRQRVKSLLQASSKKQLLRPVSELNTTSRNAVPLTVPKASTDRKPSTEPLSEAAILGERYADAKDWPRAIHYLKRAIQADPQSAALYRAIASTLARNNQIQQAAAAWYRAFTLDPDWPNASQYAQVGDALAEQGKLDAAINCYRKAIALQPNSSQAYYRLARLLESQGRSDMAKAVLKRLETERPAAWKPPAPPMRSALAVSAEPVNFNSAVEQALRTHKQAEALQEQKNWGGAIATYQKAIELNPDFSWSYHSLGDCYKALQKWSVAAAAYQKAIELKPDFVWSYYSRAEVAEAQADWPIAAQYYRRVLELEADNAQAPPRLAGVLQQLIATDPRNISYYKELAERQVNAGEKDKAIATYQMALQIRPDEPTIALALSKLIAKQDPQQAHALIDRALSHTVTNRDIQSPQDLQNLDTTAALLSATHLFDPHYYRATNPELSIADDSDLLMHYLRQGSAEGRNPNPLFDERFYRDRHPELAQTNPLAHFHRFGYLAGSDPHPFFKTTFYQKTHEDVAAANINPLEHYLAYGAQEGRAAFASEQLTRIIEQPTPADAEYLAPWIVAKSSPQSITPQRLAIYCNSLGNYFITEIADFIAGALQQAGHTVIQLNEKDTPPADLDGHWVIAPHEFFYLGKGSNWIGRSQWLSQAAFVNVEQPQTTWFSKAFHFLRHAKVIFDINVKSTAIMRSLKLPAYWLPLGYLPQYAETTASAQLPSLRALKSLPAAVSQQLPDIDAPLSHRPLDLHFIGTLNPRREQFFAKSAQWLSPLHCFLHIPPMGVPLLKGQDQALDTAAVVGLSRRSKILLNIHRDELPYFEWHRIVFHGLWQNTLVVTEPCHDIPGLVAGEHFVECSLSEMPAKIDWLLNDPQGQAAAESIRRAGYQTIQAQFRGSAIANSALQIAQTALQSNRAPAAGGTS